MPESVGTFLNFSICAASATPFVEPLARRIAVTTTVDRGRAGDEAAGRRLDLLRELVDRRHRIVAERARIGEEVVARHLRALRQPVRAVTGPRVQDRRAVAGGAEARHEGRAGRRTRPRSTVTNTSAFTVEELADDVVDVVAADRLVGLLVDDLAAELREAGLERRGHVLEVDDDGVGRDRGSPPAAVVRVLGHRRAFVLRDVAEAEGEPALRAEALRPHLVGADARRDREHAAVQRLGDGRCGVVDVTRREHDVRALASSLSAQAFETAGLLPCVSQVLITSCLAA